MLVAVGIFKCMVRYFGLIDIPVTFAAFVVSKEGIPPLLSLVVLCLGYFIEALFLVSGSSCDSGWQSQP